MKRLGLPFALALGACSGHQTFDDGSDSLGGKRPTPSPVIADAGSPPEPLDAGGEGTDLPGRTAPGSDGPGSDAPGPDATGPNITGPNITGPNPPAETTEPEPVSSAVIPDSSSAPPIVSSEAVMADAGPGCFAGVNYDQSFFEGAGLSCDQFYCPQEPVVMPWVIDRPLNCYTAQGNVCASQLDEGGFFFEDEDGLFAIEFGFDSQLGQGELTDATLTENFRFLSIVRMHIDATSTPSPKGSAGSQLVRFDYRWEAEELYAAGYEFRDGRLIGEISGSITDAYYDISEKERGACGEDDIIFDCKCHFDSIEVPYTLNLDAAFVLP